MKIIPIIQKYMILVCSTISFVPFLAFCDEFSKLYNFFLKIIQFLFFKLHGQTYVGSHLWLNFHQMVIKSKILWQLFNEGSPCLLWHLVANFQISITFFVIYIYFLSSSNCMDGHMQVGIYGSIFHYNIIKSEILMKNYLTKDFLTFCGIL